MWVSQIVTLQSRVATRSVFISFYDTNINKKLNPNFAIEFVVVVLMLEDYSLLKKLKAYLHGVKSKLF